MKLLGVCPVFLLLASCVVPDLLSHDYTFTGRILDERSGLPVEGAIVEIEALTAPFNIKDPRFGRAATDKSGTYSIEISELFCHSAWIIPPLGVLGGSGMNELKNVRIRVRVGEDLRVTKVVPVTGRESSVSSGYRRDHPVAEVRLPEPSRLPVDTGPH
jgi:hypothetical protein